jgi:hypothetical protein
LEPPIEIIVEFVKTDIDQTTPQEIVTHIANKTTVETIVLPTHVENTEMLTEI